MKLILVVFFMFFTTFAIADTVEEEIANSVPKYLKKLHTPTKDDPEPYKYDVNYQTIEMVDLNKDGILDVIALLTICEVQNCHITTENSLVIVLQGNKSGNFTNIGEFLLSGFSPTLISKPNGSVLIKSYGYGDNDPSCCPSEELFNLITVKDGKAIMKKVQHGYDY